MAFKNSLKIIFGKGFFSPSRAAASLLARLPKPAQRASEPARARRPTSRAGLLTPSRTALASAQPAPFPCSPRAHASTAAENFRRVATTCRRRPPRGSRGLTPRPRARLHLLVPVRSLTPARAASPPLQS